MRNFYLQESVFYGNYNVRDAAAIHRAIICNALIAVCPLISSEALAHVRNLQRTQDKNNSEGYAMNTQSYNTISLIHTNSLHRSHCCCSYYAECNLQRRTEDPTILRCKYTPQSCCIVRCHYRNHAYHMLALHNRLQTNPPDRHKVPGKHRRPSS